MARIVCIVQNIGNRATGGLSKTFNNENNEFINSFLYEYDAEHEMLSTKFGYDNWHKYLLICEDKVTPLAELTNNDSWEILFICESIGLEVYRDLVFDESTLFMYHRTPHISDANVVYEINGQRIKKGKQGQHEPNEQDGYKHLLELTQAWVNGRFNKAKYAEAKQKIIDWFGINDELEAKLKLLHNCLVFGSDPLSLDILLSSYNEAFSTFNNVRTDKSAFDKEYIEALTKFRNDLLDF